MFKDNFFKRVENKTNINKETILTLASKLQNSNMKDEKTIREVIKECQRLGVKHPRANRRRPNQDTDGGGH